MRSLRRLRSADWSVRSNRARAKSVRWTEHRDGLIVQANGPSLALGPWPLALGPLVRPWTRPQFRGLFSVVLDRIGFPPTWIVSAMQRTRLQRFRTLLGMDRPA